MAGGGPQGNAVHLKELFPKGVHVRPQGFAKGLIRGIRTEKEVPFQENPPHGMGKKLSGKLKDLLLEVSQRGTLRTLGR